MKMRKRIKNQINVHLFELHDYAFNYISGKACTVHPINVNNERFNVS